MSKTTLPFGRIDSITLDMALPGVFAGQEKEGHVALSEVWMHSLTFSRPGRYMIEAESGAGKSSLCSFIYGNRSDYLGHILFNGTDVRTLSIEQWCQVRLRHLAMLPQEMKLFAELTVMENIQIKNRLTGTVRRLLLGGICPPIGDGTTYRFSVATVAFRSDFPHFSPP